jgi:hypothetical protein
MSPQAVVLRILATPQGGCDPLGAALRWSKP